MDTVFHPSGIVLLLLPKGGLQTTVMFALAAWLVIYGLFLTRRLLRAYHRVIRIFDDTRADDIGAYIKWLSISPTGLSHSGWDADC